MFRDRSSSGVGWDRRGGGSLDSVGSGVTGVTGHVSSCGGVTGGACGSSCRSVIGVAGGGVGGKCGGARLAHRYLLTRPGAPGVESFPRSVVFRVVLLEVREHVLGAVGGPEHQ